MGSSCRKSPAKFAFWQLLRVIAITCCCLASKSHAQILLPPPPRAIPPPAPDRNRERPEGDSRVDPSLPDAIRKKREERLQKEDTQKPIPPTASELQDQALREEAAKPRPFAFMTAVDLVITGIKTSGSREDYTAEPTAHHYGLWRVSGQGNDGSTNPWVGYRIAPFSGTAKNEGVTGRYGFTYFGPMIGLGKFSSGAQSVGQPSGAGDEQEEDDGSLSRHGFLFSVGINAQSRSGRPDANNEEPPEDLDSKAATFDSPGFFLQAQYIHVSYGAVGIDYVAGAQLGKGKSFYWIGLGVCGFY